tara:strand:- start:437 stop:604 length:168 start_codon:yes stop_codon:yes gene_type:complete
MNVDDLIILRNEIFNAVENKSDKDVYWAINDLDTFIYNVKNNKNLPILPLIKNQT